MKVSVVIPAYNEEKTIKNCLDSLINQSEKPEEIIVVDNNSTDKTVEIVKEYKGVKILHEDKQGITPTRNKGFNYAKGDIIARCDADTITPPNWIERLKEDFSKDKSIVAVSTPAIFHDVHFLKDHLFFSYMYLAIPILIIGSYPLIGICLAIKKTAWDEIKIELCHDDTKVHEDIDLTLHIKKLGKIFHDSKIVPRTSGRRLKYNPSSFLGEYTIRFLKMFWSHRHLI